MLPAGLMSFYFLGTIMDAIVGKRVRLLAPLKNPGYDFKPTEKLPVGSEGTIIFLTKTNLKISQIAVRWDDGSALCLFPELDEYEIYER